LRRYIRTIAIVVLAIFTIVLTVSFATAKRGKTVFGAFLGAIRRLSYVAGQIYQTTARKIYDAELLAASTLRTSPSASRQQLFYANATFFVLPFILLSRLPYAFGVFHMVTDSPSVCLSQDSRYSGDRFHAASEIRG
jgi:hypothetical protein